ncbi:MAG: DUF951 domain-containing protein [Oscillospiraceae bacterium]|jgi:hypothetical protein|nr:DUF951 domain-containing protein [Oscillospiraceae bacterium]
MDIRLGDILLMKKPHPCGSSKWTVLRIGMDFRIRCLGCGHEVMRPRTKVEKAVKSVERDGGTLNRQSL